MTFWKRQNCGDGAKASGHEALTFLGEIILHEATMVDTGLYALSNPRTYTTYEPWTSVKHNALTLVHEMEHVRRVNARR